MIFDIRVYRISANIGVSDRRSQNGGRDQRTPECLSVATHTRQRGLTENALDDDQIHEKSDGHWIVSTAERCHDENAGYYFQEASDSSRSLSSRPESAYIEHMYTTRSVGSPCRRSTIC